MTGGFQTDPRGVEARCRLPGRYGPLDGFRRTLVGLKLPGVDARPYVGRVSDGPSWG